MSSAYDRSVRDYITMIDEARHAPPKTCTEAGAALRLGDSCASQSIPPTHAFNRVYKAAVWTNSH